MKSINTRELHHIKFYERIEVRGAEGCAYTLLVVDQGEPCQLVDKHGLLKRFNSIKEISELLAGTDYQEAVLIHDTAYDEMIGHPVEQANTHEIAIRLH